MSGKVNLIPTLRKFRGVPVQANSGVASLETFSGGYPLKKSPCIKSYKVVLMINFDITHIAHRQRLGRNSFVGFCKDNI